MSGPGCWSDIQCIALHALHALLEVIVLRCGNPAKLSVGGHHLDVRGDLVQKACASGSMCKSSTDNTAAAVKALYLALRSGLRLLAV